MQDSLETKAILRRMKELRCDLDEGAQEIAESARDMGEWRSYVKNYPWICMGVACYIGYVIVPRRRLGVSRVNRSLDQLTDHSRQETKSDSPSNSGIRGALLMFAGNLLARTAMSYATRQANQYFAAKSVTSPPDDQQ
jgi:hypothetical protein